jgi:hypothetical protein
VAKDRVPCGRLSDLHDRVRCHGVGIRTWIAPGCSGYPGLAQLAAAIGLPPGPISSVLPLTVSPLDPVLPFGYFNRYFLTLFGRLVRHAGHDRASHFFCLARGPATRKQLTLS